MLYVFSGLYAIPGGEGLKAVGGGDCMNPGGGGGWTLEPRLPGRASGPGRARPSGASGPWRARASGTSAPGLVVPRCRSLVAPRCRGLAADLAAGPCRGGPSAAASPGRADQAWRRQPLQAAAEASPGGGGGCVLSGFGRVNDFQAREQGIGFVRAFVSSTHFLSFFLFFNPCNRRTSKGGGKRRFWFEKPGAYAQTLKSKDISAVRLENRGSGAIAPLDYVWCTIS
jgi:hypothetical protein